MRRARRLPPQVDDRRVGVLRAFEARGSGARAAGLVGRGRLGDGALIHRAGFAIGGRRRLSCAAQRPPFRSQSAADMRRARTRRRAATGGFGRLLDSPRSSRTTLRRAACCRLRCCLVPRCTLQHRAASVRDCERACVRACVRASVSGCMRVRVGVEAAGMHIAWFVLHGVRVVQVR